MGVADLIRKRTSAGYGRLARFAHCRGFLGLLFLECVALPAASYRFLGGNGHGDHERV